MFSRSSWRLAKGIPVLIVELPAEIAALSVGSVIREVPEIVEAETGARSINQLRLNRRGE